MTKRAKQPKPDVSVYVRHGDTCGLAPHCQSLGCASGFASDDYELVAQFVYFQEAIDYAQAIAARGVNTRLVSRIVPTAPHVSEYPAKSLATVTAVQS
jgi:hypothetical protein